MSKLVPVSLSFRLQFKDEVLLKSYGQVHMYPDEVPRQGDEMYLHPMEGCNRVISIIRHHNRVHPSYDGDLSLMKLSHIEIVLESVS